MKQQITQEQWDELTPEQKRIFSDMIDDGSESEFEHLQREGGFGSIGDLIEFLDDEIYLKIFRKKPHCWSVSRGDLTQPPNKQWNSDDELCDALWEAVKYKLYDNPTNK